MALMPIEAYKTDDIIAQEIATSDAATEILASYQEQLYRPNIQNTEDYTSSRDYVRDFESAAREEIDSFEFQMVPFFQPRAEIHRENFRYYQSHQWSDEDIRVHLQQKRKPYAVNIIRTYFKTLLGEQRSQRTDFRAVPMNPLVEEKTDGMNHFLRWFARKNNWNDVGSDIFRDGVIGGVGVAGVMRDYNDPFAFVACDRFYPLQFMWDIPSAKDPLLKGTKYLERMDYVDLSQAIDEFPQWAEEIRSNAGYQGDRYLFSQQALPRPMIHAPANQLQYPITYNPYLYQAFRNYIFKREFYRRRYERKFCVRDGTRSIVRYFDLSAQGYDKAVDFVKESLDYYANPDIAQMLAQRNKQVLITAPYEQNAPYIDKLVFFGQKLVQVVSSQQDSFPYKFYIPEWIDGELTSEFEHGKGLQRYINRVTSFLDQSASGVKGITVYNKKYFDDKWTSDKIRQEIVSSNPVLEFDVEDPDFDVRKVFSNIAPPADGQKASVLAETMKGELMQMFGGPNAIGQSAFAGQSGKNAAELHAQASVRNIPLYDKWRGFQAQVGEEGLKQAAFMDETVQQVIRGDYGEIVQSSFVDANISPQDALEFEVDIDEVVASPSERASRLQQLTIIAQTNEEIAQVVAPMMIEDLGLDFAQKKRIADGLAQSAQARADQSQHERNMEEREMALREKTQADQAESKRRELDILAANMTKLSISAKADGTTPSAILSELLNKGGVAADPAGVASDMVAHRVINTDLNTLDQKAYDANMPEYEKDAIKNKVAVKKTGGTTTPKDRRARSGKKNKK